MTEKIDMSHTSHYRSIFISDIHLGTRDAKVDYLLDFLKQTDSDYLYLVGDIFDLWKLKKGWYWPAANNELIAQIFAKAKRGTKVTYIPGNHDDMLRDYCDINYNGVELKLQAQHTTADGREFLVIHGDEFDTIMRQRKHLVYIGDRAYDLLLRVNRWFNLGRRRLGFNYWSLSAYLKHQARNAFKFIDIFEQVICDEAQHHHVDGIICGHIHHAAIRRQDGCEYRNTGDWVENCTALVEDQGGKFKVIRWMEQSEILHQEFALKLVATADKNQSRRQKRRKAASLSVAPNTKTG